MDDDRDCWICHLFEGVDDAAIVRWGIGINAILTLLTIAWTMRICWKGDPW